MLYCPKCNAKWKPESGHCHACGYVLPESDSELPHGTEPNLDSSNQQTTQNESRTDGLQDTVDFPKIISPERAASDLNLPPIVPSETIELHDTLDFPVSDSTARTQEISDAQQFDSTVDAVADLTLSGDTLIKWDSRSNEDFALCGTNQSDNVLNEAADGSQVDLSTIDLTNDLLLDDGQDQDIDSEESATVDVDLILPVSTDLEATLGLGEQEPKVARDDNQETLDLDLPLMPLDPMSTIDATNNRNTDSEDTLDLEAQKTNDKDMDFTIDLDQTGSIEEDLQGTARYTDQAHAAARAETGRSGSEGRLKRMWHGAAASTGSPMHTLKGSGALASESIFARVSPRVLVTQAIQEIVSVAEKRAKKDKEKERALVKHCIETACAAELEGLADYQINGYLGKGAMGVVLQAKQIAIGRDVALKMIQPSSDGSRSVASTRDMHKKFLYEAQITGKLDHPNIVPVYELGMSNEVLFYAMKKIVGTEWKSKIGELKRDENLDIFMKICDAMAFSHRRDIIHRDLKPENVMLGPFGEVLVTDWGCAVDLSLKESFTGAGSPPWMAPEMALQNHSAVGTRSDIYLLGAILYQVVTGRPPHPGRTVMEVLLSASRNQIIPVENPEPLLNIAMRAMETRVEDRYETVEDMQADIREYRRHSESIALTERSQLTLEQAIDAKDYERFSRCIFGFQDALELWPENEAALAGLQRARFAYGKCAFDKKDYDLCLETLNREQTDEAQLYQQAKLAKEAALQRENRFKRLRKAFAAAILTGLATSSMLAGIAWLQRNEAVSQKQLAERSAVAEKKARQDEEAAKNVAIEAQVAAEKSAEREKLAKNDAISAKVAAERAAESEKQAKLQEERAKDVAIQAKFAAEKSAESERAAKIETEQRTAQVELAGLRSSLALALSQVDQLEVARAGELLQSLATPSTYQTLAGKQQLPKLKTWAWNRIHLLSNRDLLEEPLGTRIVELAYAPQAGLGVVAIAEAASQSLKIVKPVSGRLLIDSRYVLDVGPNSIQSLLISQDGKQVVYSIDADNAQASLYRWDLNKNTTTSVDTVQSQSLQGLLFSGKAIVAGLNNGLWIWNNADLSMPPIRVAELSGRLMSIQLIDEDHVLALAEMANGQRYPHVVRISDPQQRYFLRTQDALRPEKLSAIAHSHGRLILGTDSGNLYSLEFQPSIFYTAEGNSPDAGHNLAKEDLFDLPRLHHSEVHSIQAHADGTLLTIAQEPLVNRWQLAETPAGWQHDIRLSGTLNNVMRASFLQDSQSIVAFSEDARSVLWNANRQHQRQQLHRISSDSRRLDNYDAPVVQLINSSDHIHSVSILENGRIDRWNTQTGLSVNQTDVPLTYVGHAPQAQFVDMAIDESAGVLVTSARLPALSSTAQGSLANIHTQPSSSPNRQITQWDWEFVKWDLNSGSMLDRWTRRTSEEQTVSLSHAARYVLYGSDQQTRLKPLQDQNHSDFLRDDFGSSFGSPHPINPHLMMLVKLNGNAMMVDTQDLEESWRRPGYELAELDFFRLATKDDRPLCGQWSPQGDRYFLLWDSGRITELLWINQQLTVGRDLFSPDQRLDLSLTSKNSSNDLPKNSLPNTVRIGSRWNVDLKIRTAGQHDLVYAAVRFPGAEGLTRLSRLDFPRAGGEVRRVQSDAYMRQHHWILTDEAAPQLAVQPLHALLSRVPSLSRDLVGARAVGQNVYAIAKDGSVFRSSQKQVSVLGRPKLLSGTGDQKASTIFTLHQGGVIWRGDWTNHQWHWRQLAMTSADAQRITVSPDGTQLLVATPTGIELLSGDTGQPLEPLQDQSQVVIAQWLPSQAASLTAILRNGEIVTQFNGISRKIGQLSGRTPVGIHFCSEAWDDENRPTTPWLVVRCQSGEGAISDELVYFHLEGDHPGEIGSLKLPINTNVVEFSPTEGLLAIGGQGSLAIYFVAPTLGEFGQELFSLPGHAGAQVGQLRFTPDGHSLLSADSSNRLIGWISKDTP